MSDRLDQLQKMHAADPADADLPYMIALEHAKQDQFQQAIDWLDKTLAADRHYHYAYFQKAKMLSELGDDMAGLETLALGIELAEQAGDLKALGELSELRTMMAEG